MRRWLSGMVKNDGGLGQLFSYLWDVVEIPVASLL